MYASSCKRVLQKLSFSLGCPRTLVYFARATALWGVNTIQKTSSKLPANVFKIHVLMLDVCLKSAGSLLDVCWIVQTPYYGHHLIFIN